MEMAAAVQNTLPCELPGSVCGQLRFIQRFSEQGIYIDKETTVACLLQR